MNALSEIPGLHHSCHQYGDHSLQRVGVWQKQQQQQQQQKGEDDQALSSAYWIVFIHGGAWRDPQKTLYDFVPSIKHMVSSPEFPISAVRGFISIDYRLSPHPDLPQDPASTPATELRIAKHPDHIQDVESALGFLDAEYKIVNQYVLVGHSAGATLAHQHLMRVGVRSPSVPLPAAIIGIAGIYDLDGLCARFEGYRGFIGHAFGVDQSSWNEASPAAFDQNFKTLWRNDSHLVILAASTEDTLIDMPELDSMAAKLVKDGVNVTIIKDLTGDHDSIWEDGSQVADLVAKAVAQLQQN